MITTLFCSKNTRCTIANKQLNYAYFKENGELQATIMLRIGLQVKRVRIKVELSNLGIAQCYLMVGDSFLILNVIKEECIKFFSPLYRIDRNEQMEHLIVSDCHCP